MLPGAVPIPTDLLPAIGPVVRVQSVHRGGIAQGAGVLEGDLIGGCAGFLPDEDFWGWGRSGGTFATTVTEVKALEALVAKAAAPSELTLAIVRKDAVLRLKLHKPRADSTLGLNLIAQDNVDWQEVHENWLDARPPPPPPAKPRPSATAPKSAVVAAPPPLAAPHATEAPAAEESPAAPPPDGAPAGGHWVTQTRVVLCFACGTRDVYCKGGRRWDATGRPLGASPAAPGEAHKLEVDQRDVHMFRPGTRGDAGRWFV